MKNAIVLLLLLLTSCSGFAQKAETLRLVTRYGTFTLGENQVLLFDGHRLQPLVQGNSGIDLGTPFRIGDSDAVLVAIFGGTACPYLYHFIIVSKSGAKPTPVFGTCNRATNVRRSGNSILLSMRGYRGPFEPEEERRQALREVHRFAFVDGVITMDGKPAK